MARLPSLRGGMRRNQTAFAGVFSDEDVVRELAMSRGRVDSSDFESLIGPHLEAGYRTALAILRDPDAAHDAVQESAVKAWRKLGQLREGRPARPWFLAIRPNPCPSGRRTHSPSGLRMPEAAS